MVALPIPGGADAPPVLGVLLAIAALASVVVIVVLAVRYLRNSGTQHDVFGPPLDDQRDKPRDDDDPA